MISKSLILLGLLSNVNARLGEEESSKVIEHLDLELIIEGERQLFPLLPGTKCPTGHNCRVRTTTFTGDAAPMIDSLRKNMNRPLLATDVDWEELDSSLNSVVDSDDFCTRRAAMTRAAGLVAGISFATVNSPAYAAETKEVKMGTDAGGLQFVPAKTQICSGDTVKWINNKGGPHNVVFDEEAIPEGVDQEKISMEDQLGEEGDTFEMSFSTKGTYEYYCEPHRGAGMNGVLVVS